MEQRKQRKRTEKKQMSLNECAHFSKKCSLVLTKSLFAHIRKHFLENSFSMEIGHRIKFLCRPNTKLSDNLSDMLLKWYHKYFLTKASFLAEQSSPLPLVLVNDWTQKWNYDDMQFANRKLIFLFHCNYDFMSN